MNVNGLTTKLNSVKNFIDENNIKVLGITESHLTESINSSFLKVPHFNFLRSDVKGHVQKHGVCAFVHEDFLIDCVSQPMSNALLFRLAKYDVYFLIVYRPPSYTAAENETLALTLQELISGKEMIILGDFNLPNIEWTSQDVPTGHVPSLESMFLDVFVSLGLSEWVSEPTFPSSGNTLDLLLTTEHDRVGNVTVVEPLPASDHCPVLFQYVFEGDLVSNRSQRQANFAWHKGNYQKLNMFLSDVDWNFELACHNACKCFDRFANIVRAGIEVSIPQRIILPKDKPPWRTNPPQSLIKYRQEAWSRYKRVRLQSGRKSVAAGEAFSAFASVNKDLRKFEVRSQACYENGLIDRFRENPKLLHSYINSKKSAPSSIGPLKLPNGELCSDPLAVSECLASSFASVFCKDIPANQKPHQVYDGHIDTISVTTEEVQTSLLSLGQNNG